MSVVSDAVDALEEFVQDMLASGIKWEFNCMQDILSSTFESATDTSKTSLVGKFLTTHPANFEGNAAAGYGLWATIRNICDSAIVPIGGFILTIILLSDLYQMVIRGNNFKDFDDSIFIKWIIKAVCGVLLISNVYYIASALFSFGTGACTTAIGTIFGASTYTAKLTLSGLSDMEISKLLVILLLGFLTLVGVVLMLVFIIVTLAGRIIEIFMYLSIGPIPMATMMSDGEWSSVGKNWIRQLLALSFQGFFIIVAIGIFKILFQKSVATMTINADSVLTSMITLLGYTFALCFTVLRTANISKSVFNAH